VLYVYIHVIARTRAYQHEDGDGELSDALADESRGRGRATMREIDTQLDAMSAALDSCERGAQRFNGGFDENT